MYKMPEVTNFKKKDNTYCCVPLCNSRGSKNPDLSFHLFPSEKKELARRKKWILALRIGRPVSHRMSVCSRHFVHSDYVLPPHYERKRPRLRKHAIPSLNLPVLDEEKREKRPTTIMIKKEISSGEAEEEKSEENVEQEDFEIEVKIENMESDRDYFGSDYNTESEQDYNIRFQRDDLVNTDIIDSEIDYLETEDSTEFEQVFLEREANIKVERDYLQSEDSSEFQPDYLERVDYIKSEQDYLETEDSIESQQDIVKFTVNTESEQDYLERADNTESERDYLERGDNTESEQDYLEIADYLEIGNDIESEKEDLESGNNIEPMTLITLSKKLI